MWGDTDSGQPDGGPQSRVRVQRRTDPVPVHPLHFRKKPEISPEIPEAPRRTRKTLQGCSIIPETPSLVPHTPPTSSKITEPPLHSEKPSK